MVLNARAVLIGIGFLLLTLPSCVKQKKNGQLVTRYTTEDEARLGDIPFYVGARNFSVFHSDSVTDICYQVKSTVEAVKSFYTLNLEREGWVIIAQWASKDISLYSIKANLHLLIIVKKSKDYTDVRIQLTRNQERNADQDDFYR